MDVNLPSPNGLVLCYQPIVDLTRREVVGVEALACQSSMTDERRVAGAPSCLSVLEAASRQGAQWAAQGLQLDIAVNFSGRQLTDPAFAEHVGRVLVQTGLDPSQLLMEMSERVFTDEVRAEAVLLELSALGPRLGLGDFGTGYSSLSHLKNLPIDFLKIDETFILGLGTNRDDEAIVASVAGLARALGSRCIAEGVDTPEQHAQLLALGCQAQGSFFASPVCAAELPSAVDRAEAVLEAAHLDLISVSPSGRSRRGIPPLAADVARQMRTMHTSGASLQTIAAALNVTDAAHPKGTHWHANSVAKYLSHLIATASTAGAR